jgi:pyruvate formate lyase activating enzyme
LAANVDPVEKKPLYHFLPGSSTFSIASAGCNFRCGFCQNWEISQLDFRDAYLEEESGLTGAAGRRLGQNFSARKVVELARQHNCRSIAYTYTEPTIYFEFALETARLAKEAGLFNIFVTNGYMSSEAVTLLSPYLDAANVDLKFLRRVLIRRYARLLLILFWIQ